MTAQSTVHSDGTQYTRDVGLRHHTDAEISAAAVVQLNTWMVVPDGSVQVTVQEGWITVKGEVEFWYQRSAIESAVKDLAGVRGVINLITVGPQVGPVDSENSTRRPFERAAWIDSKRIQVETSGDKVILRSSVGFFGERGKGGRATRM